MIVLLLVILFGCRQDPVKHVNVSGSWQGYYIDTPLTRVAWLVLVPVDSEYKNYSAEGRCNSSFETMVEFDPITDSIKLPACEIEGFTCFDGFFTGKFNSKNGELEGYKDFYVYNSRPPFYVIASYRERYNFRRK